MHKQIADHYAERCRLRMQAEYAVIAAELEKVKKLILRLDPEEERIDHWMLELREDYDKIRHRSFEMACAFERPVSKFGS